MASVKDNGDSERGNPLPPHGLFFPIRSGRSIQRAHSEVITSAQDRKRKGRGEEGEGGGGGDVCNGGYKRIQAVRPESAAGGGRYEIWNVPWD